MNLTSLYKPPSSAPDFVYNPRKLTQEEAQAYCHSQGGHLAAYISKQEQYLVEQTLVNKVGGFSARGSPAWSSACAVTRRVVYGGNPTCFSGISAIVTDSGLLQWVPITH
jgi:hypothetical protein